MSAEPCLVLSTCAEAETAARLARGLVEARLATCVNILPGLTSIYAWQGQVETAAETLLLVKTTTDRYPALESWLRTNHPYELPEILMIPVARGLPDYLQWVSQWLTSD